MHRTREMMPKTWTLKKKGTKYISASGNKNKIPLVVLLRDMIKEAKNKKEAKKIIKETEVKVNHKKVNDYKFPLELQDLINVNKKNYILVLGENKKFLAKEINEKDVEKATYRVIGKKVMKNKKVQINLNSRNYLVENKEAEKIKTGDSLVINLKSKKIIDILPIKEKAKVIIINGKHIGGSGTVVKIDLAKKIAEVSSKNKKINVLLKYLMVVET